MAEPRQCGRTGVGLIPSNSETGVRVAKTSYGPISAPVRTSGSNTLDWNRYDSPGRTTYIAADEVTAFTEVLGGYARPMGAPDSQFELDALALGVTLSEYRRSLARDENERPFLASGYLPERWRETRSIYEVVLPSEVWFIDIEHPQTMRLLRTECSKELQALGCSDLTNGVLRGEDRRITTMLATYLRGLELDTGQNAAGLHFGSKRTGKWSRAVWLSDDSSDDGAYLGVTSGEQIYPTRPTFLEALNLLEINPF